ncbi:MAG: alpha-galactosidase, partial [Clostridia bacterium]|nr:alpha-galactosidase [Clostridia bacterium]
LEGELFFFEDMESDRAFILISENPDWCTGTLSMPRKTGALTLDSKGYPVVYGECRRGECEALCRAYLRHANHCPELVTMSNTWGDCNSADRVCEAFIRKEIEAAKEMGVDIVQIDDGWQSGNILFKNPRDERGNRTFDGPYWDMNRERFPNGVRPLTEEAAKDGIRVGMWFAPSSHHCFALLERDKAALRKAYEEEGARFFKLDMYQAESKEETDKMLELLAEIYSFGPDVSVQMDVTRYSRLNYLCGREYGTIFVENRYTKTANSFPHRVLRNLWNLSRYLPTNRFQFELVNPDLNRESYGEKDPFAPALYEMDYLFATVMLSNPLFWMEMQFLSEERRRQLAPIMKVWKEHRSVLSRADVMPVGERPCGRSISGFYLSENGKPAYLLLFREVTDRDTATISLPVDTAKAQVLISNADVSVSVENGVARATFSKPRSYAFVKLD